jgi:protease-4
MKTFLKRLACDVPMMSVQNLDFILSNIPTTADIQCAEHPYFKNMRQSVAPKIEQQGDVAIVPVQGTLAYNPDPLEMIYDGVEDSRIITSLLSQAAADPKTKGVLLRMDTPGGMLLGGPEMADGVDYCRALGKPVVTHVGGLGCSLGYMVAARSNSIVANRSAIVGSIGVISSVTDYSAMLEKLGIKFEYFTNDEAIFKSAGAIGSKLTDDQRAQIKAGVNSAFDLFKSMVSSNRPQVKAETMRGQTLRGSEAKNAGLVDAIGDENYALSVLRSLMPKN